MSNTTTIHCLKEAILAYFPLSLRQVASDWLPLANSR